MVRLSISIPDDLDEKAKRLNLSPSQYLKNAFEAEIRARETKYNRIECIKEYKEADLLKSQLFLFDGTTFHFSYLGSIKSFGEMEFEDNTRFPYITVQNNNKQRSENEKHILLSAQKFTSELLFGNSPDFLLYGFVYTTPDEIKSWVEQKYPSNVFDLNNVNYSQFLNKDLIKVSPLYLRGSFKMDENRFTQALSLCKKITTESEEKINALVKAIQQKNKDIL